MKIIQPSVEILRPDNGIDALRFIEKMARISHRSEEAQTSDSWQRFIKTVVLDHGDWSVVEHVSATVLFRVNRGVTHELVRHRLFSFTQESTRFVRYGGKQVPNLEFIQPAVLEQLPLSVRGAFTHSCMMTEKDYFMMLDHGARPQEARSILPNALAATIAVTGNLRNWRHFLIMRTSQETHPDFKQVSIPLLSAFQTLIPIIFDDIEPEQKQSLAIKKAR